MSGSITQISTVGSSLNGFKVERIEAVPELRSTAYIFKHEKTGARLLHLFNEDPNNLFSIAFRTPVYNSTGVPHILEHSVLGGSKKFPLKDPFQELLKGSLQTFLNALTYPDKTVYPVSSQVEKDFFNLVDVYCDAVLNPLLTENTFYQEGWHFDVEDVSKPVSIKGIVYNEMKGVFSDFSSHVDRKTFGNLFPDTSYHYESGGEPEHITDLTYEQFKDFHHRYYHPSNSFIFLYGNIPSEKTLKFLNDTYLSSFDALPTDSQIKKQPLWSEPRSIKIEAPATEEDNGTATVVQIWIFGSATDPVLSLTGGILAHYLLGTESSPLKRALIDSGLGEDLDDISGFEGDLVQSVFAAGLRKTKPEHSETIRKLILDTLRKQVEGGMDMELLEGSVRQTEFYLREIIGGHFPYNLRLMERCLRSWIYDGDPLALLAFEKPLSTIKEQFQKQGAVYFQDAIRKLMLDNKHNLLSTIVASSEMGKRLEQQTENQAKILSASFGQTEKDHFHKITAALMEQQKNPPSPEALATLPKLDKSDLPRKGQEVPTKRGEINGVQLFMHPIFTSGVVYFDIGFDLRVVPMELIEYLPLYSELLTRCGAGKFSYEEMSKRISLSTGGIDSSLSCKTMLGTQRDLFFYSFFHGKALEPRFDEMLGIMSDLFLQPDLKNKKQIKDILLEERNGLNSSIISSGHSFAVTYASSRLSASRMIDELMGGVSQLRFLDEKVKEDKLDKIVEAMERLHKLIINRSACVVSITTDKPEAYMSRIEQFLSKLPSEQNAVSLIELSSTPLKEPVGIEISSAVNFVAKAWAIPVAQPYTNGLLFLIARNLSTGYLWDKVRVEGGAYGGMSMYSVAHPVFACASYRDPNLVETLSHFEKGLQEVASGIDQVKIDQSIIGAIGRIDVPRTPHAQGLGETIDLLMGYTPEYRQQLRDAVLGATSASVKEIAQMILNEKLSVVTVLGNKAAFDSAESKGIVFKREPLL